MKLRNVFLLFFGICWLCFDLSISNAAKVGRLSTTDALRKLSPYNEWQRLKGVPSADRIRRFEDEIGDTFVLLEKRALKPSSAHNPSYTVQRKLFQVNDQQQVALKGQTNAVEVSGDLGRMGDKGPIHTEYWIWAQRGETPLFRGRQFAKASDGDGHYLTLGVESNPQPKGIFLKSPATARRGPVPLSSTPLELGKKEALEAAFNQGKLKELKELGHSQYLQGAIEPKSMQAPTTVTLKPKDVAPTSSCCIM